MALAAAELGQVILLQKPLFDNAVSTLNPLMSQVRGPGGIVGEWQSLPVIKRRPMSSALGPFRMVEVVGNVSGGAYTPGGVLPAAGAAQNLRQQLSWGTYNARFSVSKYDLMALENGTLAIEGYLDNQRMSAANSIMTAISADVFNGTGLAGRMAGLNAVGINGAAYGGINRVAFPNHQPMIDTAVAPRAVTVAVLDNAWDTFRSTVEYLPGQWFGVTSVGQMTALRALAGAGVATWQTGSRIHSLGQNSVDYNGMPIFVLPNFPNNAIDFYNADGLAWEFQGNETFEIDEDPQYIGDTYTWNVYSHCAICLDNPRKNCFSIDQLV